jgi:hypothetical protein
MASSVSLIMSKAVVAAVWTFYAPSCETQETTQKRRCGTEHNEEKDSRTAGATAGSPTDLSVCKVIL